MSEPDKKIKYDRFQPCEHKGCLNHKTHPCEGCGRIGGNGIVYEEIKKEKGILGSK